jgi:hypothetical protein
MSLEELGLVSTKNISVFDGANPLESFDMTTSRARKEPNLPSIVAIQSPKSFNLKNLDFDKINNSTKA